MRVLAFFAVAFVASCATAPKLVRASFADDAKSAPSANPWVDLRGDGGTLCARDAKGAVACVTLEAISSCAKVPCTGLEPNHFHATTAHVPPIAATAIAVAHSTWLLREDGSVSAFRFEKDGEPKVDDVPWFHGALAIEATSFAVGPEHGMWTSENNQWGTQACARMPNEIRCTMPTTVFMPREQLTVLMASSAITVGWRFGCAITATRARNVMCWGTTNFHGQLGDGTRRPSRAAVLVRDLGDVIQIDASRGATCALRADGRVACWGRFGWDDDVHDTPQWIPELTNAAEIALGFDHLCARLRSGAITCVGKNDREQLGSVEASEDVGRSTIDGLHDVVKMIALDEGTCALRSNHSIVCWGMRVAPETIALSNSGQP